jgi:hypothetical protein
MPCCRHALSGVALFVASVTALLLRQAGCLAPMRRHEACAGRLPAAVKALTDQQPGHCGCMVPVTGVGSAGLLCGGQRRWQGTVVNATGWERCLVNASGRALLCGQCHGVGTAVWSMPLRGHCCVVNATGWEPLFGQCHREGTAVWSMPLGGPACVLQRPCMLQRVRMLHGGALPPGPSSCRPALPGASGPPAGRRVYFYFSCLDQGVTFRMPCVAH